MSDKTLELLLQEREIRKLLDEHLRITVERVEAIAGKIENRSDESLAAVDQAKQDLIEAKAAIATELANAKKDIGELAVQRTLSVFSEARNVVLLVGGLAIPLIVGSGFIGYSSLKSSSIAFIDAKVREWMSVSMPNSPVKETLEKFRNRAVVDALSIRLARQTYDRQPMFSRVELSADEKNRLCQVMLDLDTSDSTFMDAARLIEAAKGIVAGYDDDVQLKEVINTVLGDGKYSQRKRDIIFETLWREKSLLNASLTVLDKSDVPNPWALFAFKNVARHAPRNAEQYAVKMLGSSSFGNQRAAADFLAMQKPLDASLRKWLADLQAKQSPDYPVIAASIATQMVASRNSSFVSASDLPNPASTPAVQAAAASLLYNAIQSGAKLRLSRFGSDPEALLWERTIENQTRMAQLDRLRAYFENEDLLTAVLSKNVGDVAALANAISALEVPDGQSYFASIQLTLSNSGWLQVEGGTRLDARALVGTIRLSKISDGLMAFWRTPSGQFISGKVSAGSNLSGARFTYLADQIRLGQLEMHSMERTEF
ncbi:hypothetical protein [Ralstonia sp. UNC404CL21Col]|uniref:hypothetical protein n=1 Tax=Ralstonia sp. UNC404CL21Col TaxID=1380362 RepID=UPI000489BA91|nr:hypothetical protein [Ralstonia sp. UNC404CL21Col]